MYLFTSGYGTNQIGISTAKCPYDNINMRFSATWIEDKEAKTHTHTTYIQKHMKTISTLWWENLHDLRVWCNCDWWTSTIPAWFGDQNWRPGKKNTPHFMVHHLPIFSTISIKCSPLKSGYGLNLRYHRYLPSSYPALLQRQQGKLVPTSVARVVPLRVSPCWIWTPIPYGK